MTIQGAEAISLNPRPISNLTHENLSQVFRPQQHTHIWSGWTWPSLVLTQHHLLVLWNLIYLKVWNRTIYTAPFITSEDVYEVWCLINPCMMKDYIHSPPKETHYLVKGPPWARCIFIIKHWWTSTLHGSVAIPNYFLRKLVMHCAKISTFWTLKVCHLPSQTTGYSRDHVVAPLPCRVGITDLISKEEKPAFLPLIS